MVALRRINGREFVINADLIEMIEATPDTVIGLTTGKKIIVQNSIEDIVKKVIKYKQLINQSIYINQKARSEEVGKVK